MWYWYNYFATLIVISTPHHISMWLLTSILAGKHETLKICMKEGCACAFLFHTNLWVFMHRLLISWPPLRLLGLRPDSLKGGHDISSLVHMQIRACTCSCTCMCRPACMCTHMPARRHLQAHACARTRMSIIVLWGVLHHIWRLSQQVGYLQIWCNTPTKLDYWPQNGIIGLNIQIELRSIWIIDPKNPILLEPERGFHPLKPLFEIKSGLRSSFFALESESLASIIGFRCLNKRLYISHMELYFRSGPHSGLNMSPTPHTWPTTHSPCPWWLAHASVYWT